MGVFLSKKMKYFMVTMEVRSFAKAAEILCITRSPLSKGICELEELLGEKLFKRTYNDLEPTELAWEYYNKCKSVYLYLQNLEADLSGRQILSPINIKFDISVPEMIYRHIIMAMRAHEMAVTTERCLVDLEMIENMKYHENEVIISFRTLSLAANIPLDKWEGGEFVILQNKEWNVPKKNMKIPIWKDNYSGYLKRAISPYLEQMNVAFELIDRNHDFPELLYHMKSGKYCTVMSRKLASMYNMGNMEMQPIKNLRPVVSMYYHDSEKYKEKLQHIKSLVNEFI